MNLVCRLCHAALERTLVDLGDMPLANAYLASAEDARSERRYPLHARVCESCWLVQVEPVVDPGVIFSDYAYFSSVSSSWSEHARRFASQAIQQLGLTADSLVLEVASNDGYLLRHFASAGIRVLGIEPAANVAAVAVAAGLTTEVAFFGAETALRLGDAGVSADLVVANNVLAHVPDLHDFVAGLALAVGSEGTLVIEFPHLLRLIEGVQFDTIYHEHYSYFSLLTAERALAAHGLSVFHVEKLATHGGSLRLWATHASQVRPVSPQLLELRAEESRGGLDGAAPYDGFTSRVEHCRRSLLDFLSDARGRAQTVASYGAAAKGNTLLNYCGIGTDFLDYTVDLKPHKQGHLLPGSHVPIRPVEALRETRPDVVVILPWNLRDEIVEQHAYVREWGGRFAARSPELRLLP
jgi:SAM-dependent methyltransferase